jgi:adenylate cyclase
MMRTMPREIERKFLLRTDEWRAAVARSAAMRQGYLAGNDRASIRVRIAGEAATLNIKSGGLAASRLEYEYAIPLDEGRELLTLCTRPLIEKTRHYVAIGALTWEIDEFHGANEGLIVAEIELDDEGQTFEAPSWLGREVTQHERYYNVRLVQHPYHDWAAAERNS